MENVSINSSEIFFVQFTYHLNMNEQKRQIKNHKNYISTLFMFNAVWFVLGIVVQSDVWNP